MKVREMIEMYIQYWTMLTCYHFILAIFGIAPISLLLDLFVIYNIVFFVVAAIIYVSSKLAGYFFNFIFTRLARRTHSKLTEAFETVKIPIYKVTD